jgi:hypothetical protein
VAENINAPSQASPETAAAITKAPDPADESQPPATAHHATVVQPEGDFSAHHFIVYGEDLAKDAVLVLLVALVLRKQLAKSIAEKIAEEFTKILTTVTTASTAALTQITSSFDRTLRDNESRFLVVLNRMEDRIVGDWSGTLNRVREAVIYRAWERNTAGTTISQEAEKLIEQKQFAKAEEKLRSARNDDWDSLKQLVNLLLSQDVNRPDDALVALQAGQAIFDHDQEFHWELARVYMAQKNKALAIEAAFAYVELTNKRKLDPETRASALISLGYTYYWFDDFASAIVQTKQALLTLGPEPKRRDLLLAYRANLSYYFAELRQNRVEALQYAEDAVLSSPRNPSFLDTRGYVRMQFAGYVTDANMQESVDLARKRVDLELAKNDFTAAGELAPNIAEYYSHLAQANRLLQSLEAVVPSA